MTRTVCEISTLQTTLLPRKTHSLADFLFLRSNFRKGQTGFAHMYSDILPKNIGKCVQETKTDIEIETENVIETETETAPKT